MTVTIDIEFKDGKEAKRIKDKLVDTVGCKVDDLYAPSDHSNPIKMRFQCGENAVDEVLKSIEEPNKLLKITPDEISTHGGAKWNVRKRRKFR